MSEKDLDYYIKQQLDSVGIKSTSQGSNIKEISQALATASKSGKSNIGIPEFVAVSDNFVIVIENKKDTNCHIKFDDNNKISTDVKSIKKYAVNGAVHYASHIVNKSSYGKVFAIGASGTGKHHKIQPVFVNKKDILLLDEIDTFENFSEENINSYYRYKVLNETPEEEVELDKIIKIAKNLHEDLRNYAGLTEQEKPLVVSAILLALDDKSFTIDSLTGDNVLKDGDKIFNALSAYLTRIKVPEEKRNAIENKFKFIIDRPQLNNKNVNLGSTPLAYFTKNINNNIRKPLKNNIGEDILGRFYGEFIKYSGGDGKGLGIVLTPRQITELFCELLELKPSDVVFDPCCGTAGYLISAMNYMLKSLAGDIPQIENIKKNNLHGIEIRDDLFTIATTNMILRGDGKSNLKLADFMKEDIACLKKIGATVGMLNPPYSQAKTKDTSHLSEMNFILKLLDCLKADGSSRAAVIVPQSVMVGKNKEQKKLKEELLTRHSLVAVITLKKDIFYKIGTNTCIAIFKAHSPHNMDSRVKFINFEDDGYEVRKHVGIVPTPRAVDRKKSLLDAFFNRADFSSKFMVQSPITSEDEWLHAFYYFNDEIPTDADFEKTINDYLAFEFDMIIQGKGYLFEESK